MYRFLVFIGTVLFLNSGFSQSMTEKEDFLILDSTLNHVKLVGAGESTHGTAKFTTFRLELFKYLVEKHRFNTFFLEADFSACQRINRYIHGENDTVEKALNEVVLWPWQTLEMVELINWCRFHNLTGEPKISFVGCDMQLVADDYLEFKRMTGNSADNNPVLDSIFQGLSYHSSDSAVQIRKARWNAFNDSLKSQVNTDHTLEIEMIQQTVNQWFGFYQEKGLKYNFRDSCMASNMVKYLELNPGSKGLYFAHNWHVSNTVYTYKKFPSTKTTGAFLKEKMTDDYLCMGLVSSEFQFNALTCQEGKYQMHLFGLNRNKRKDIERLLSERSTKQVEIVPAKSIPRPDKYRITEIGASYGKNCNGLESTSEIRLQKEMFDFYGYIRSSGATTLLK